jgi:hypothetical protein
LSEETPGEVWYDDPDGVDAYQFVVGDVALRRKVESSVTRRASFKLLYGESAVDLGELEPRGDRPVFSGRAVVEGKPLHYLVTSWSCAGEFSIMGLYASQLPDRLPHGRERLLTAGCPEQGTAASP